MQRAKFTALDSTSFSIDGGWKCRPVLRARGVAHVSDAEWRRMHHEVLDGLVVPRRSSEPTSLFRLTTVGSAARWSNDRDGGEGEADGEEEEDDL